MHLAQGHACSRWGRGGGNRIGTQRRQQWSRPVPTRRSRWARAPARDASGPILTGRGARSAPTPDAEQVWDTATAACVNTVTRHNDYVMALAYSPVTNRLVSGGLDKVIHLWDLARLGETPTAAATTTYAADATAASTGSQEPETAPDGAAAAVLPSPRAVSRRTMSPMADAIVHSFSTAA